MLVENTNIKSPLVCIIENSTGVDVPGAALFYTLLSARRHRKYCLFTRHLSLVEWPCQPTIAYDANYMALVKGGHLFCILSCALEI